MVISPLQPVSSRPFSLRSNLMLERAGTADLTGAARPAIVRVFRNGSFLIVKRMSGPPKYLNLLFTDKELIIISPANCVDKWITPPVQPGYFTILHTGLVEFYLFINNLIWQNAF